MLLRKRAQSTAEYAITIGIVVAVVAGIMQVALKGGMRKKSAEATQLLTNAGTTVTPNSDVFEGALSKMDSSVDDFRVYDSEARSTTVDAANYVDRKITHKGGGQTSMQQQSTASTSLSVESYGAVHDTDDSGS